MSDFYLPTKCERCGKVLNESIEAPSEEVFGMRVCAASCADVVKAIDMWNESEGKYDG